MFVYIRVCTDNFMSNYKRMWMHIALITSRLPLNIGLADSKLILLILILPLFLFSPSFCIRPWECDEQPTIILIGKLSKNLV